MTARYVELQVTSNFSFLRGASHPEELAATAAALDHAAAAITDRNSLAGAVRAWRAARETGIRLLVGARLDLVDGASLLCFPTDRAAYGRLCRLLTLGKRRAPKGECHIGREDALAYGEGQIMIVLPPADRDVPSGSLALGPESPFALELAFWRAELGDRCYLAASHLYRGDDARRLATLDELATHCPTRRSSPPTTSTPMRPNAGRCRTCSPASGRAARSTGPASACSPTPSAT